MRVLAPGAAALAAAAGCLGEMYDLPAPQLLPPPPCPAGCARWRDLAADGSPQGQTAADRMWLGGPPAGAHCAQPGRAVHCCNMYNASLSGTWPDCAPIAAPLGGGWHCPEGPGGADCREELRDKARGGLRDSPLCDPAFPSRGPGFNGAFCWCKSPAPGAPTWGTCVPPKAVVQQVNLQLASRGTVVVSFATFHDPASTGSPPVAEFGASAGALNSSVSGITHVYGMNDTGHDKETNKRYYLHFVVLRGLPAATRHWYRVRSGGSPWTTPVSFLTPPAGGPTRLAMFGDMGVYAWNAMGPLKRDGVDRSGFDAIVHMGDHAYNYGDSAGARADGYLQAYEPVLSRLPWIPVVGNHEGFDSFYMYFNETDGEALGAAPHPMTTMLRTSTAWGAGSSSGSARWFSVDVGLVHIVAIDCMVAWGESAEAAEQLRWLRSDLAAVDRAATPWVVAVSHYPVVCSGCDTGTPAAMVDALEPLFLEYGVDIAAAGHWHYYESLWPAARRNGSGPALLQRRSFVDPTAPVYVTAGGGGPPGPDGGAGAHGAARRGFELYSTGRLIAHNATHLTWRQVLNEPGPEGDVVLDEWTVSQSRHGRFHPVPGELPTSAPSGTPAPLPSGGRLQLVPLEVCRHYWNWECNASLIPGGPSGGGQGGCCLNNASDPFFTWRDQGSGAGGDLQLWTVHPAAAYPGYYAHTADRGALPPPSAMGDYRLGDYGEPGYFGPLQGPGGVWAAANFTSGLWAYGSGAPLALYDPRPDPAAPLLAPPVSWELAFRAPSARMPRAAAVAVWRALPPVGYVALGDFVTPSAASPPQLRAARVVAQKCVADCAVRVLWCDAQPPRGNCSLPPAAGGWTVVFYTADTAGSAGATAPRVVLAAGALPASAPCIRDVCTGG